MSINSQAMIAIIVAITLSYLIGSLSFAVIISKLMRLDDPRTYGSKNPGATNVLRSGNKKAAIITLVLDALKGAVPVLLARYFATRFGFDAAVIALCGLAAFMGHLYPVFFRFKGGKGVATALGVIIGLHWPAAIAGMVAFALLVAAFRYVSLGSMVGTVVALFYWLFNEGMDITALVLLLICGLLIYRHRGNIDNLLNGKERKLGEKKA
jgi:acyl phosphate:glycerol-3-phosphate acyltransferase